MMRFIASIACIKYHRISFFSGITFANAIFQIGNNIISLKCMFFNYNKQRELCCNFEGIAFTHRNAAERPMPETSLSYEKITRCANRESW